MNSADYALLVERHHAECFLAEARVPGVEAHRDRDITWVVHDGATWRNAGIMVRFQPRSAAHRLDTLVSRYKRHGRGIGFWISPASTPGNIPELLTERRLRCQKYFPAMVRELKRTKKVQTTPPKGLEISRVLDANVHKTIPHPAIGAVTTELRRRALHRLAALLSDPQQRTRSFVASLDGQLVGAIETFVGETGAGIHGLTVLDAFRGRGIGTALVEHACEDAARSRANTIVLLATTEGQRVYSRRGFVEVARFGYWYRSFQR
jgi:GNAT superfamily N-acetyltransferase